MLLRKIIFKFKGRKPQQSSSEPVEHLSIGDRVDTCQSVQQIQRRAQKRKASEEQAPLPPVSSYLFDIYGQSRVMSIF